MASSQHRFVGYPRPREGPQTASASAVVDPNPIMRGWSLVLGARAINWFQFLAKAAWSNAKFGGIQDIESLEHYNYNLHVRCPNHEAPFVALVDKMSKACCNAGGS
ncbi:hypothetical protein NPX13_g10658 [Xylaria arbuscula]|uniref:Uncharacterized protein n=1 Tax=Xylaria arbuscula TaxID=114810 RepID=A0A9W8N4B5_9PEZI|nr:hypothetical protein NPX13_g10658 [Xylaria arbuscula]